MIIYIPTIQILIMGDWSTQKDSRKSDGLVRQWKIKRLAKYFLIEQNRDYLVLKRDSKKQQVNLTVTLLRSGKKQ